MRVSVHLYTQSNPVEIRDVLNTYQKGALFCVSQSDGTVQKFPLCHIFRVMEYLEDE